MKILITGNKGQLGNELCGILARGESELGAIPEKFRGAELTGIDLDRLDITNKETVLRFVKELKPDLIVNCAAYTNVDACETHEEDAYQANAIGPRNLAEVSEVVGAKFVHISTDYVFNGQGRGIPPRPYREDDEPDPISAYGRTKLAGERFVSEACSRAFIVRTAWLYSRGPKNFVRTMIRLGKEKGAVSVVNDQVGTPTFTPDLAHQILKLAATDGYGIYHCTGKGQCSWYEFAAEIMRCGGINALVTPCSSDEFPSPAKRPAWSVLSHEKIEQTVGDDAREWKEALKAFFR